MPCISVDVIIDGFVLISSAWIGFGGFGCSSALNGVYPVDIAGYFSNKNQTKTNQFLIVQFIIMNLINSNESFHFPPHVVLHTFLMIASCLT